MFGYIKPLKPEMKVKEFDTYQAIYCGLCRQLGATFGPAARLTLSYDFAFLSMLAMALQEDSPCFARKRCFANPFKKKFCCGCSQSSRFSACVAMIMLYYKVRDNLNDSGFWGKLLALPLLPPAACARKKARREYPQADEIVSRCMLRQAQVEEAGSPLVDEAADPSAEALSAIFGMLSEDPAQKRVLERMGYLLGRWVYCIDALDDLEEDRKSGGYNPFLKAWGASGTGPLPAGCIDAAVASLYATTAEIAAGYELLELHRYKPILDNIIYLGLKNSVDTVKERRNGND